MTNETTTNVRNAFENCNGATKAFAEKDGTVYVYDNVAGHYTTCHSLTENQKKRVRRLATR